MSCMSATLTVQSPFTSPSNGGADDDAAERRRTVCALPSGGVDTSVPVDVVNAALVAAAGDDSTSPAARSRAGILFASGSLRLADETPNSEFDPRLFARKVSVASRPEPFGPRAPLPLLTQP